MAATDVDPSAEVDAPDVPAGELSNVGEPVRLVEGDLNASRRTPMRRWWPQPVEGVERQGARAGRQSPVPPAKAGSTFGTGVDEPAVKGGTTGESTPSRGGSIPEKRDGVSL